MSIVYRREDEKHRQVTRPRILRFLVRLVQGTSFWWNESSESNSYPKVKSFQSKPKEAGQEESLWWQFGDTSRCFNGWHFASWVRNLRKDSQWGGSLTECLSDIRLSTVYNVSPFSFFFLPMRYVGLVPQSQREIVIVSHPSSSAHTWNLRYRIASPDLKFCTVQIQPAPIQDPSRHKSDGLSR